MSRAAAIVAGWDPSRPADFSGLTPAPRRRSSRPTRPLESPCGSCDGSGLVFGPPRGTVDREVGVCTACAGTGTEPDA